MEIPSLTLLSTHQASRKQSSIMKLFVSLILAPTILAIPIKTNVEVTDKSWSVGAYDNWEEELEAIKEYVENLPDDEFDTLFIELTNALETDLGLTVDELDALSDDEIDALLTPFI